jgi:Transglutaminase-like superfamily/TAT (twin-arginine translocation) pathway signal sequence
MNRRNFLRITGAAAASLALPLPKLGRALAATTAPWRVFEVTTHVELLHPKGVSRAWVPLPLAVETDFQKLLGNSWDAPGGKASFVHDTHYGVTMVSAEWPEGVKPMLEVKSKVTTRDWTVDLSAKPGKATLDAASRKLWTAPTHLIRTDGLVLTTAQKATEGVKGGDVEKARALYAWVCDNSYRDPKTKGCGLGDVNSMLATQTLGGKCADINGLFVGLARSLGIPARDVYGIRVANSQRGYKALGRSGDITKAQHCRAEFFAEGYGWIPVDAGDVRKVILEEPPGNLAVTDPKVQAARSYLLGNWEMNWMAYNYGHDVPLPGSSKGPVGFLMYPQGETADGLLDCLDAPNFQYTIASREVSNS